MARDSYHLVHGLEKGLAVLRALNRDGPSSAAALAAATELPRPTVHRLVETLLAAGYVGRSDVRGVYRLTGLVRLLADGYHPDDAVADAAQPILARLCDEIVWPTDVLTYNDAMMTVRATTHPRSPLSIHRAIVGARFPLLSTASGQLYLSFCSAATRREILRLIRHRPGPDAARLRAGFDVEKMVRATRRRGYAFIRHRAPARTSSIAVPIAGPRGILACLTVIWISSAMPVDEAVPRLVPALTTAAAAIARDYRARIAGGKRRGGG